MHQSLMDYSSFKLMFAATLGFLFLNGCQPKDEIGEVVVVTEDSKTTDDQPSKDNDNGAGKSKEDDKEAKDETYWETVTRLYENAKASGSTSAQSTKEWISEMYGSAKESGSELGKSTSQWLESTYQSAKESGNTSANSAKEWYDAELEKLGTWEYKTVAVASKEPGEVTIELNKLGLERWECFHSESGVFYFKRPVQSQFDKIPTRELIRILPFLL